ncbi:MAG: acyl-CoA thioesterase [Bdellovibrionaceae bacterium]|nr:acyl-CoA thioesterase [Pseudobdellovibrionaceae bacterium]
MTQLVLPGDTNSLGSVFGGTVMSWIDICAAIAAQRHSNSEVVTASIDQMSFVAPVYKGWVVNLKASVNFVAKTSMEVGVRVDAENPKTGETFHTASAYLTFVAIGSDGKPVLVPGLTLESENDRRRFEKGQKRREYRVANRAK